MWLSRGFFVCVFAGLTPSVLAHVVEKFGDVKECLDFFVDGCTPKLLGVMVNGTIQDQNRFRPICQHYENKYRYATLYDTQSRIPVFSAYVYRGKNYNNSRAAWWMSEPQLEEPPGIEMSLGHHKQAAEWDYRWNKQGVNKGHIFPRCHANDNDDAISTFTLTNAVPQVISFNNGSWCAIENSTKTLMENSCRDNNNVITAYVVTGAAPSNGTLLNDRVNIPSMMWTALCCYDGRKQSWGSVAHWGLNKEENKTNKPTPIPKSLVELYDMLNESYPGVSIFPKKCHNMTLNEDLSKEWKDASEAGGCSCDEIDDPCDIPVPDPSGNAPGMLYGSPRQHTLLVFSVSAILILRYLQ